MKEQSVKSFGLIVNSLNTIPEDFTIRLELKRKKKTQHRLSPATFPTTSEEFPLQVSLVLSSDNASKSTVEEMAHQRLMKLVRIAFCCNFENWFRYFAGMVIKSG